MLGRKRRKTTSFSPTQATEPQPQLQHPQPYPQQQQQPLHPHHHNHNHNHTHQQQQTERPQPQHAPTHPIDLAFASLISDQQHQNHRHTSSRLVPLLPLPPPQDSTLAARRLLSTPWARHEFFYCNLDRNLFREGQLDFQTCLNRITVTQRPLENPTPDSPSVPPAVAPDVGVGAVKMTRDEWAVVRCLMGRPRRLSHKFLNAERERLTHQRHRLRKLQLDLINNTPSENDNDFDAPVPDDIPPPMVVGQRVVARYTLSTSHIPPSTHASFHPGELAPGTIIAVDLQNCRYRVKFDTWETDIGWVDDTDLMSVGPLDLVPWRPLSPVKPSSPTAPVALAPLLPCPSNFESGGRPSGTPSSSFTAHKPRHDDRGRRSWQDKGTTCVYPVPENQSSTHHSQNIPHQPLHQCKAGYCFADSMDADQVLNALLAELRAAMDQMPEAAKPHVHCDYADDADPILMLAIVNTLKLKKSMVDCLKSMNRTAQTMLNNQSLPQPYTWNDAFRHRYSWLVDRISLIDRFLPSNILKMRGATVATGGTNGANTVPGSKKTDPKDALPQRYRSLTTGLDLLSELSMEMRSVEDSDDRTTVGTAIPDCVDGKIAMENVTKGPDSVIAIVNGDCRPSPSPPLKVTRERVKELIDKCVALLVRIQETGKGQSNAEDLAKALKAMLPPTDTQQPGDSENVSPRSEQADVTTDLKDNLSIYKEIELLVRRMHPRLSGAPTPDGIR